MEQQKYIPENGHNAVISKSNSSNVPNRVPGKPPLKCFDTYMGGKLMEKNYLSKYKISAETIGEILNRYRSLSGNEAMPSFNQEETFNFKERKKDSPKIGLSQDEIETQSNATYTKETRQSANCNDNKSYCKYIKQPKEGICSDVSKTMKSDQYAKVKQSNCYDVEPLLDGQSNISNLISPLRGAHHFKYGPRDYLTSSFRQRFPFSSNMNFNRMNNSRRPVLSHDDRTAHTLYEKYLGGAGDGKSKSDLLEESRNSKVDSIACERRNRRWNSGEHQPWQSCNEDNRSQVVESKLSCAHECRSQCEIQECISGHCDCHQEAENCSSRSNCCDCEHDSKFHDSSRRQKRNRDRQRHHHQETSPDVCRRQVVAEIINALSGWERKRERPWRQRGVKKTKIKKPKARAKSCDSLDKGKNKSANRSPSIDVISKTRLTSKSRTSNKPTSASLSKKGICPQVSKEKLNNKSKKIKEKNDNSQSKCEAGKCDQSSGVNICCNNEYCQACCQTCCCCCCGAPIQKMHSCSPQLRQRPCVSEAVMSCPVLIPPYQPRVSAPGVPASCVSNEVPMGKLLTSLVTEQNPFADRTNLRKNSGQSDEPKRGAKNGASRKVCDKKGIGLSAPEKFVKKGAAFIKSVTGKTVETGVKKKSSKQAVLDKPKSGSKTNDRNSTKEARISKKSRASVKRGNTTAENMPYEDTDDETQSKGKKSRAKSEAIKTKNSKTSANRRYSTVQNMAYDDTDDETQIISTPKGKKSVKSPRHVGYKPDNSGTETNDEGSYRQSSVRKSKKQSKSPRQSELQYLSDPSDPVYGSRPQSKGPSRALSPANFGTLGSGALTPTAPSPGGCSPTTNVNGREEYNIVLSVPIDITDAEVRELLESVSTLIRQKSAPTRRPSPPRARHPTVSCLYAVSVGEGANQTANQTAHNSAPCLTLRHVDQNDSASPKSCAHSLPTMERIDRKLVDKEFESVSMKNNGSLSESSPLKSKSYNIDFERRSPRLQFSEPLDNCQSIADKTKAESLPSKVEKSNDHSGDEATSQIRFSIRKGKVQDSPFLFISGSDDESPTTKSRKKCIKMKFLRDSRLTPWNDNFKPASIKHNANENKTNEISETVNELSVDQAKNGHFSPNKSLSNSKLTKQYGIAPYQSVSMTREKSDGINKGNIYLTSSVYSSKRAIKAPSSPFRQRSRSSFNACGNNVNYPLSSSDPCYSKADVANALRQTLDVKDDLPNSEENLQISEITALKSTTQKTSDGLISKLNPTSRNENTEPKYPTPSITNTPVNNIATPNTTPTDAPAQAPVDAPGPPWWWARGPRASSSPRPRHDNLSCCNANYPDEGAVFRSFIDQLDMSLGGVSHRESPPAPSSPASTITRMLLELPPPPPEETFDVESENKPKFPKFCLSSHTNSYEKTTIPTPVVTPSPSPKKTIVCNQNTYYFSQFHSTSPLAPANINSSYSIDGDSLKSFEYHEQSFVSQHLNSSNSAYSNTCNNCSKSNHRHLKCEKGLKKLIKSQRQKYNLKNCTSKTDNKSGSPSSSSMRFHRGTVCHTTQCRLDNSLTNSDNINNNNLVYPVRYKLTDKWPNTIDKKENYINYNENIQYELDLTDVKIWHGVSTRSQNTCLSMIADCVANKLFSIVYLRRNENYL